MKMTEIKKMAQGKGVKAGKLKKAELIKAIQEQEGNFPCYLSASDSCDQMDCCWRGDCLT